MFRWDKLTHRCPLLSACLLLFYVNASSLSDGAQAQSLPSQREIEEALNTVGSFLQSETGTKWLTELVQTRLTPLKTDELMQAILQEAKFDDKILQAANMLRVALSAQILQNGESNATVYLQTPRPEGWEDVITDIEKHDNIICLYRKDMTEINAKQSNDWQKLLKTISPDYTVHLALDKSDKYVICLKKIEIPTTEATFEGSSINVASEKISSQTVVPLLSTIGVDISETRIKTTAIATTIEETTTVNSKASIKAAVSNRKSLQPDLITLTNKLKSNAELNSKVEDIQEDCSDEDDTRSEDDDYIDKEENSESLMKSRKYLENNLSNDKKDFPISSSFSRPRYFFQTGINFDSTKQPRVPGQLEKFMPVNFSTNQELSCSQPRIFFTVLPVGCNSEKAMNPLMQINEARKRGIPIIINLPIIATGQIQTYALPIFRTKANVPTFETQMCSKPFLHPSCVLNSMLLSRSSILKPQIPSTQTGIFNSKANVAPISQKSFVQRFVRSANKFPSILKLIKINPTCSVILPNYIPQNQLKQTIPMTNPPILPKSTRLEISKRNFRSVPLMYTAYKLHSKLPMNTDPRPISTKSNYFQNTLTYKSQFSIIPTLAQTQSILPRLTPTWQNCVKRKLTLRPTKQELVSQRNPQIYALNQSTRQLHPTSIQQLQQRPLKRQPILFKPIHNIANYRYNPSVQRYSIFSKPVKIQATSSKPIPKLFAPIPFATIPIIPMESTPTVSRQTQINPTLSMMPNFPVSKVPLHRSSVIINSAQQMLNGLGSSNINSIAPCPSPYNKSVKLQINIQGLVREPVKVTVLSEPDEHVRITADGPGSIVNSCFGVPSGRKNMGDLDGKELVENNTITKVTEQTTKIWESKDIIDEVVPKVQNKMHDEDAKLTKESIDRHEDTVNFVDKIPDGQENEWPINETTIRPTDNVQVVVVTTEATNSTDTISHR